MKIFTFSLVLIISFVITSTVLSQSIPDRITYTKLECKCQFSVLDNQKNGRGFISRDKIVNLRDRIIQVSHVSKQEKQMLESIEFFPVLCTDNAMAIKCDNLPPYILYLPAFMDRLAGDQKENRNLYWTDYFVFAHEIGHHYLKHTEPNRPQSTTFTPPSPDIPSLKRLTQYVKLEKQDHVDEFQADVVALKCLKTQRMSKKDVLAIYDILLNDFNLGKEPNNKHPSTISRKNFANKYWDELGDFDTQIEENRIRKFADTFYDTDLVKRYERMNEKRFIDLQPIADITYGKADFKSATGNEVMATVNPAWSIGLRTGFKQWSSPHGFDLSLRFMNQQVATYTTIADVKRTVEKFTWNWLSLEPAYTFHTIGLKSDSLYKNRGGLFFSIGGLFQLPLQSSYTNYSFGQYNLSSNKPGLSISPAFRFGVERWIRKLPFESRRGALSVSVSYTPVQLHFEEPVPQRSTIQQVSLSASYTFW